MSAAQLALGALLLVTEAAHAGTQSLEVRVRLRREQKSIEVSGYALRVSPPTRFLNVAVGGAGMAKAKITHTRPGLWLVEWDGREQRIESERLVVRGQRLRLGVEPVPYDLQVLPGEKRGVDVIAALDMEAYLTGVLPSEMPISWPLEALKAQAIAARSFVMRSAFERRDRSFDVDSTIIDQVYKFMAEAEHHPEWKVKLSRAIRETRGEVLVDHRHRIVKAFYSADCGCQTEDPRYVWGRVEALTSVKDPTCRKRPLRNWNLTLSRADVRSRLLAFLDLPETSSLRTLHVGARTPSGRVADVIASLGVGGKTRTVNLGAQEFRKIYGFRKIRSTDFSLRWVGDTLEINGTGVGHGVGLCQSGARSLAEEGLGYREILRLYYPKAKLWTLKRT